MSEQQQLPPPKASWWTRLNTKPPDWDKPSNRISRWTTAILMGALLVWIRSRH